MAKGSIQSRITKLEKQKKEVPNPCRGRPKGAKNKFSRNAVEAIWGAHDHLQKDKEKNLNAWAAANPTEFYTKVFVKVLPKDVNIGGSVEFVFTGFRRNVENKDSGSL